MFFRRSIVAVMVQNAIESTAIPGQSLDTAMVANMLVAKLWRDIPDVVAGRGRPKPSNFSLAIGALTDGLDQATSGSEEDDAMFFALGGLLQSPKAAKAASSNETDRLFFEGGLTLYLSKGHERGLLTSEGLAPLAS